MVRVTGNFVSEGPLSQAVREALLAAFDQGWADPKKLSQAASRAAILRNQSIENIASRLGIPVPSVEVLGEPNLGHFLAIAGFLREGSTFAYSSIDKGKVRSIARTRGVNSIEVPVSRDGQIEYPNSLPEQTTLSLQLANGETGITQQSFLGSETARFISIDATSSGPRLALPPGWDSALFDARSWNGPSGISILAIANRAEYTYPLPHIAPISAPGSYSLPLLIAASIALDTFTDASPAICEYLVNGLTKIEGVEVVGRDAPRLSHVLSCTVSGVRNEAIAHKLAVQGIDIDAGSACSPADLQPSHVIASMGYATEGHLRFTLRSETTQDEIDKLLVALVAIINSER
ncbi:NifS Cysteine sulfinate desulfinase/cysteine desulfurase and related enzymes [Candidatus Nanopelagicaceae bacterium]